MEKLHNTETFNNFAAGRRIITYGGYFLNRESKTDNESIL